MSLVARGMSGSFRALRVGVVVAAAALLGLGCTARHAARDPKADYVAMYSSGQYQAAYEAASREASSLRSSDKERASLIAGLSAQALDRDADAERWLKPILNDVDAGISGKASAAMGLIYQERGAHAEAAPLLAAAAGKLLGDDRARAAMYAGDSYRAMSKLDDAKAMYMKASQSIKDGDAIRVLISERLAQVEREITMRNIKASGTQVVLASPSPPPVAPVTAKPAPRPSFEFQRSPRNSERGSSQYSVQAGVYSTWDSAVAKMGQLRRVGSTRITETRDAFGRRLYAVRVGYFESRSEAEAFRPRVGRRAEIVASEDK